MCRRRQSEGRVPCAERSSSVRPGAAGDLARTDRCFSTRGTQTKGTGRPEATSSERDVHIRSRYANPGCPPPMADASGRRPVPDYGAMARAGEGGSGSRIGIPHRTLPVVPPAPGPLVPLWATGAGGRPLGGTGGRGWLRGCRPIDWHFPGRCGFQTGVAGERRLADSARPRARPKMNTEPCP